MKKNSWRILIINCAYYKRGDMDAKADRRVKEELSNRGSGSLKLSGVESLRKK